MSHLTELPNNHSALTELEFCAWLGQAVAGDVHQYHAGFLALDVTQHVSRLDEQIRLELVRVGRRAFWAAERGFIHLVQRRIGPDAFSYLAIARPRPRKAHAALSALLLEEAA